MEAFYTMNAFGLGGHRGLGSTSDLINQLNEQIYEAERAAEEAEQIYFRAATIQNKALEIFLSKFFRLDLTQGNASGEFEAVEYPTRFPIVTSLNIDMPAEAAFDSFRQAALSVYGGNLESAQALVDQGLDLLNSDPDIWRYISPYANEQLSTAQSIVDTGVIPPVLTRLSCAEGNCGNVTFDWEKIIKEMADEEGFSVPVDSLKSVRDLLYVADEKLQELAKLIDSRDALLAQPSPTPSPGSPTPSPGSPTPSPGSYIPEPHDVPPTYPGSGTTYPTEPGPGTGPTPPQNSETVYPIDDDPSPATPLKDNKTLLIVAGAGLIAGAWYLMTRD